MAARVWASARRMAGWEGGEGEGEEEEGVAAAAEWPHARTLSIDYMSPAPKGCEVVLEAWAAPLGPSPAPSPWPVPVPAAVAGMAYPPLSGASVAGHSIGGSLSTHTTRLTEHTPNTATPHTTHNYRGIAFALLLHFPGARRRRRGQRELAPEPRPGPRVVPARGPDANAVPRAVRPACREAAGAAAPGTAPAGPGATAGATGGVAAAAGGWGGGGTRGPGGVEAGAAVVAAVVGLEWMGRGEKRRGWTSDRRKNSVMCVY